MKANSKGKSAFRQEHAVIKWVGDFTLWLKKGSTGKHLMSTNGPGFLIIDKQQNYLLCMSRLGCFATGTQQQEAV